MEVALLCIGDELLKGSTVNTNLAFLGEKLLENGMIPKLSLEVPDRDADIRGALGYAFSRADVVLTSGGLGPTADDLTKSAVANWFGLPLVHRPEAERAVRMYWHKLHSGTAPVHWIRQADLPEGAETIPNGYGSAPGIRLERNGKMIILMPGPPSELRPMFTDSVLPLLKAKQTERVYTDLLRIAGVGESEVEDLLEPHLVPEVSAAYCAQPGLVRLFLTSKDDALLKRVAAEARELFRADILPAGVTSLPEDVLRLLKTKKLMLATAESCTGGMISEQITAVPGSSNAFLGGVNSYANEIKTRFLGVSEETLRTVGAVSRECAEEMVNGIADRAKADAAISVTGIAGPGGATPGKPVGLVYIGVRLHTKTVVLECHFRGGRDQVRERTAAKALNTLRSMLLESAE